MDISDAGQQFMSKDLRLKSKPVVFTVIKVSHCALYLLNRLAFFQQSNESPDAVDADVTVKRVSYFRLALYQLQV